jgi:muconolactone delta-isomerase
MIEVVSGKGARMFTSFWNDGQEAEARAAARRRAEEKGATVRVERNGELLAIYRPTWRRRTYRSALLGAVTIPED